MAAKRRSGGPVAARPFEAATHSDEFDRLVREQRTSLERFTRRLGASLEDAEEIAATALLRAYQSGETHREAHVWRGWLRAVARNLWIDSLRRRRIHLVDIDHAPRELVAPAPAVDQLAEEAQNARAICAAIALLPPPQRAVLYLREIRGLSYQEIASTLQLSESAVTSTLHRARAAIDRTERPRYAKLAAAFGVPLLAVRAGAGRLGRVVASSAPAAGAVKVAIPVAVLAMTGATLTHRALERPHQPSAGAVTSLGAGLAPPRGLEPALTRSASPSQVRSADTLAPQLVISPLATRSQSAARPGPRVAAPTDQSDPVSAPPAAAPPAAAPPSVTSPEVTPSSTLPGASSPAETRPDAAPPVVTTPASSHPATTPPGSQRPTGDTGNGSSKSAAPGSQASAARSAAAKRRSLHQATPPGSDSHAPATPALAASAAPSAPGKPVSSPAQGASTHADAHGPTTTNTSPGVAATAAAPAAPTNAATPVGPPAQTPPVAPATPAPPAQTSAASPDVHAPATPVPPATPADPNGQAQPGHGRSTLQG
jgi:RNA polymerase sigma factor (sigma-70 family)